MSDNIDYDELDRAIAETQKRNATKKSATKTTSKARTIPAPAPKAKTATPVAVATHANSQNLAQNFPPRRRVYMDFIGKPRAHSVEQANIRLKNAETPAEPKRVAHFATATPGMPNYRIANSHQITAAPAPSVAPKPVMRKAAPAASTPMPAMRKATPVAPVKPVMRAAQPSSPKPVITKVAAPAPKAAMPAQATKTSTPAVKAQPSSTALAAAAAVKSIEEGPKTPNANNYSLGVRSPYIRNDAKVEKRPLNGDVSEYVQDDKIEKNEYAEKPIKAESKKKARSKHTVKKNEKSNSSWYWPILVVLIVAAGGGLGYLLWWILQGAN